MKVIKFGGTSLGTPERMQNIASLIINQGRVLIILSAISGTTNRLVQIAKLLKEKNVECATSEINLLYEDALTFSKKVLSSEPSIVKMNLFLLEVKSELIAITKGDKIFITENENILLSKGELVSTQLFSYYLDDIGLKNQLLPALEFMYLDINGEPDLVRINKTLNTYLTPTLRDTIFITQGFICSTFYGQISNLKRGGSDYSAAIIGAVLQADEIQIWTDIDGMHNNDPRIISDTQPVPILSYQEAAELAYFGAKILHPGTVHPARQAGIPIRIKNTMDPNARGTLINSGTSDTGAKAIAAKDNITMIRIDSSRMLMAYGFLKSIFEIFENYKTPIDMITTSEVAVSLTIDDPSHLPSIVEELKKFGVVEIQKEQVIICIAGFFPRTSHGYAANILSALKNVPLQMVSYGGSEHNISILVEKDFKLIALQSLHQKLFTTANV